MLILIRTTLLALDQANKTGNYTVLRDLGAPGFPGQHRGTARRNLRPAAHATTSTYPGSRSIDPQLTLLPQIEANGLMRMAGFFPSVPTQVNFELAYAPVGGRWRLFALSVSFGQARAGARREPPRPRQPPQAGSRPMAPKAAPRRATKPKSP